MITLCELYSLCARRGACPEALEFLKSCKTIEEAMACRGAPNWAVWIVQELRADLSPEDLRVAVEKACEDPVWAEWLAAEALGLSEDLWRMCALKACESPKYASWLIQDFDTDALPADIRLKAELKTCEDPNRARGLVTDKRRLLPETIAKLQSMGLLQVKDGIAPENVVGGAIEEPPCQ